MVSRLVVFAGNPLGIAHHAFRTREVDVNVTTLNPADHPSQKLTAQSLELLTDAALLRLPKTEHDRLLGRLRRNPPEIRRRHLPLQSVSELGIGMLGPRLFQRYLDGGIRHALDHGQLCPCTDIAARRVDAHAQFIGRTDRLAGRGNQRLLDQRKQRVAFDPALVLQVLQDSQQFAVHRFPLVLLSPIRPREQSRLRLPHLVRRGDVRTELPLSTPTRGKGHKGAEHKHTKTTCRLEALPRRGARPNGQWPSAQPDPSTCASRLGPAVHGNTAVSHRRSVAARRGYNTAKEKKAGRVAPTFPTNAVYLTHVDAL